MKLILSTLILATIIVSGCKPDDDTPPAPTDYFKVIVGPDYIRDYKVKLSLTDLDGNIFETLNADSSGEVIFAQNIPPTDWMESFHLHVLKEQKGRPERPYLTIFTFTFMEPGQVVKLEGVPSQNSSIWNDITIERNSNSTRFTDGFAHIGYNTGYSNYYSRRINNMDDPDRDLTSSNAILLEPGLHNLSIGLSPVNDEDKLYWYYQKGLPAASNFTASLADFTILENPTLVQINTSSTSNSLEVFGSVGDEITQYSTSRSQGNQLRAFIPDIPTDVYALEVWTQEGSQTNKNSRTYVSTIPTEIQEHGKLNVDVLDVSITSPSIELSGHGDNFTLRAYYRDYNPSSGRDSEAITWGIYGPGDEGIISLNMPTDVSQWFPDHSFANNIYSETYSFCGFYDNSLIMGYRDYINMLIGDQEFPTQYSSGDEYHQVSWNEP